MMKTPVLLACAALAVASVASAQETAARGAQEVQASYSALKTLIMETKNELKGDIKVVDKKAVDAMDRADSAVTFSKTAINMAKTATSLAQTALTNVAAVTTCTKQQMFFDPNAANADKEGCVASKVRGKRIDLGSFMPNNKAEANKGIVIDLTKHLPDTAFGVHVMLKSLHDGGVSVECPLTRGQKYRSQSFVRVSGNDFTYFVCEYDPSTEKLKLYQDIDNGDGHSVQRMQNISLYYEYFGI